MSRDRVFLSSPEPQRRRRPQLGLQTGIYSGSSRAWGRLGRRGSRRGCGQAASSEPRDSGVTPCAWALGHPGSVPAACSPGFLPCLPAPLRRPAHAGPCGTWPGWYWPAVPGGTGRPGHPLVTGRGDQSRLTRPQRGLASGPQLLHHSVLPSSPMTSRWEARR